MSLQLTKIQVFSEREAVDIQQRLQKLGCKGGGFSPHRIKWLFVNEQNCIKWDAFDSAPAYRELTLHDLIKLETEK